MCQLHTHTHKPHIHTTHTHAHTYAHTLMHTHLCTHTYRHATHTHKPHYYQVQLLHALVEPRSQITMQLHLLKHLLQYVHNTYCIYYELLVLSWPLQTIYVATVASYWGTIVIISQLVRGHQLILYTVFEIRNQDIMDIGYQKIT